jgi:hypothetical protein
VCRGEAGVSLLDTYETERRPVAERVVSSGAAAELAEAMTDPRDRAARDEELRRTLTDPDTEHHEAAAASELDRVYARSRAVAGDDGPGLGRLLPDTPNVQPVDGEPRPLHELTHRPGHTLLVLGGPRADARRVAGLVAQLGRRSIPAVDAVIGLSTRPDDHPLGRMDESVALQLGVRDVTILGVRPDRYIGLRDDRGDPRAVMTHLNALIA